VSQVTKLVYNLSFQTRPSSNYTDINQILDQILNITDQSLDEAQVKTELKINTFDSKGLTFMLYAHQRLFVSKDFLTQ
jgi:hypothetical protein